MCTIGGGTLLGSLSPAKLSVASLLLLHNDNHDDAAKRRSGDDSQFSSNTRPPPTHVAREEELRLSFRHAVLSPRSVGVVCTPGLSIQHFSTYNVTSHEVPFITLAMFENWHGRPSSPSCTGNPYLGRF
jgi:hypothetical protein